jgi:acyl dehydratase
VPGLWLRDLDTGVDYSKVVHAGHAIELFAPLPTAGTVIGRSAVQDVIDRGEGRGALVIWTRDLLERETDMLLARITQSTLCRGDGGFGGPPRAMPDRPRIPDIAPALTVPIDVSTQAALLYRLNGDDNPLHAVPAVAREAGFQRPILHGLASFGIAGWCIAKHVHGGDAGRLCSLQCSFSAPVYPGDRLEAQLWHDGAEVRFRIRAPERASVVIDNGLARFAGDEW